MNNKKKHWKITNRLIRLWEILLDITSAIVYLTITLFIHFTMWLISWFKVEEEE